MRDLYAPGAAVGSTRAHVVFWLCGWSRILFSVLGFVRRMALDIWGLRAHSPPDEIEPKPHLTLETEKIHA